MRVITIFLFFFFVAGAETAFAETQTSSKKESLIGFFCMVDSNNSKSFLDGCFPTEKKCKSFRQDLSKKLKRIPKCKRKPKAFCTGHLHENGNEIELCAFSRSSCESLRGNLEESSVCRLEKKPGNSLRGTNFSCAIPDKEESMHECFRSKKVCEHSVENTNKLLRRMREDKETASQPRLVGEALKVQLLGCQEQKSAFCFWYEEQNIPNKFCVTSKKTCQSVQKVMGLGGTGRTVLSKCERYK